MDRSLQAEFATFLGHKNHDDELILRVQNYFEDHYNHRISIGELTKKYNINRRTFDRRFIKVTGLSPLDYL